MPSDYESKKNVIWETGTTIIAATLVLILFFFNANKLAFWAGILSTILGTITIAMIFALIAQKADEPKYHYNAYTHLPIPHQQVSGNKKNKKQVRRLATKKKAKKKKK